MHYVGYHKLHLTLAVDFTASNGQLPIKNKNSYHYIGSKERNPYEKTMAAMMSSIFQYNDQVNSRLYGFGQLKTPNHMEDHWVIQKGPRTTFGIIEVRKPGNDALLRLIDNYRSAAKSVKMGLQGEFREIIEEVAEDAMSSHSYAILVIMLDGDKVSNLESYMATLRQTFRSGMSIVVVGIGDEKFQNCKMMQSEVTNFTFVRYIDDQEKMGIRALRKVPQQIRDYYASRKEAPEIMGHVDYFT